MRRVKAGYAWHEATDHLMGTDEYGTWEDDTTVDSSFSVRFDSYSRDTLEFMFATGDGSKWLITTADAVDGPYSLDDRTILKSR